MPLKTQLRDSHGEVLEQIVFTSLNMLSRVSNAELEPGVDAHNYHWIRRDAEPVDADALSVSWESTALPAGFRMTASARQVLPAGPVEHLVFSDGLASVSVFVEVGHDGGASGAGAVQEDAAALGASSAFSTMVQGYRVTAVGEVPPETVRVIAQAIRNAVPAPVVSDVNPEAAKAAVPPPSSPVFLPGARSGFDAPAPAPISHSLGADRPVFGPMFPAAPPGLPAGGGPGRR
jgi:hypothetical protein